MGHRTLLTALLICLLLTGNLFTAPDQAAARGNERLVPDPGVVSYTFRHQFDEDFEGTLDMIKEMGFTKIEFSNLFGNTAQEVRDMLDERGLSCPSFGVGYGNIVNDIERVIGEAKILGAHHVRVAWIPHDAPFDIQDARRAVDDFNRAGRTLKQAGIQFSYHNHGYEFRPYGDGTLFDYMMENTDPEYVGYQMDTFWMTHPGADAVELMKKYPDRFTMIHMKDLREGVEGDFSGGAPSEYDVPLGTGQVDFPALLRAARDAGVEYYWIEDETENVVERVPQSREYIRSIRN